VRRLVLENWGYKLLSLALALVLYLYVRGDLGGRAPRAEPPIVPAAQP
jgi:YbbR domain-containing protein